MSSPIGDGNGTRSGCRITFLLAAAGILLILLAIAIAAIQISDAVR